MDAYGVSRNTVRLALGLLRTDGLVVTGQGRGSFVAEVQTINAGRDVGGVRHVVAQLDHDSIEFGEPGDARRVDVSVAVREAATTIAEALGLRAGSQVIERRRLLYRDGRPSHIADTFMSDAFADNAEVRHAGPLTGGVAAILEDAGRKITRYVDELSVRMPTPAEAQHLQIATGVPVIVLLRTLLDNDALAVCATVSVLPGDRNGLRYTVTVDRLEDKSDAT